MATVTTSSSGKKKLVYKQDPDGVFRLKKLGDDDRLSTKSDKRTVDDYLNDLISCAYQVVDPHKPLATNDTESIKSDPKPEPAEVPPPIQTQTPHHRGHNLNVKTMSAPKVLQSPTPTHSPVKEVSPGLNISIPTSPPASQSPDIALPTPVNDTASPVAASPAANPLSTFFSANSPIFHIPSFGLGAVIAVVVTSCSSYIVTYSKILFDYAKIGLVWALILGCIFWYCGLIKIQDISTAKASFTNMANRLAGRQAPAASPEPEAAPVPAEVLNVKIPQAEQFTNEDLDYRHSSDYHDYVDDHVPQRRSSGKSRMRSRSRPREQREYRESRKNTINVVPFKPQPRPDNPGERSNSVPNLPLLERHPPPKLNRFNSAEPKTNYARFVERSGKDYKHKASGSVDSFDSSALKYPSHSNVHHLADHPPSKSYTAPLPSLPDEDLPFVNEIKLVNSNEELDQLGPMSHGNIKRSNTTNSKKSVLGTRANYSKFLENTDNYDYE